MHERIVGVNHKRAMYYVQSEVNHRQVLLEFALTSLAINRYKNKYTKQAMRLLNRTTIMLQICSTSYCYDIDVANNKNNHETCIHVLINQQIQETYCMLFLDQIPFV